ncbi:MAG: DUF167 domain-containing protein [Bacteroidota bacterium]|jgi:uncharacterized protein (TIGR00251 family)
MKISIRVKPNARKNEVKPLGDNTFLVSVTAPPVDNKANEKMIEVLAEYFGRPKRTISILRGTTAKQKIVQIT